MDKLQSILLKMGKEFFEQPKPELLRFTDDLENDIFINDIENYPHAFVLSCCMDRQMNANRAWSIASKLKEMYDGDFSIECLASISVDEYIAVFEENNLHRFNFKMAQVFYNAVHRIVDVYGGDASQIWSGSPSSAAVVCRFLEFEGVGIKIATMATNILARQFKVPMSDYSSIDISPDVHIRRVMYRCGLINDEDDTNYIIYKAREICPEFAGIIDSPLWNIGRSYCHPSNPICSDCPLSECCPKRR